VTMFGVDFKTLAPNPLTLIPIIPYPFYPSYISVSEWMTKLTLDIVGVTMFGVDFKALSGNTSEDVETFMREVYIHIYIHMLMCVYSYSANTCTRVDTNVYMYIYICINTYMSIYGSQW
jgi:hypothetical protein